MRPTLSEILARLKADALAAQPGVDVELPRSLLGILLFAFALTVHEAWGHLQSIADDAFADTSDDAALQRHAALRGLAIVQGLKATGTAVLTTDAAWTPVEAGRRLVRADGWEYEIAAPIWTGSQWEAATTSIDAGTAGDYVGNVRLIEPSPGIGDVAVVMAGGVDPETPDELRARLLDVIQAPPQGGTADDFERWALEGAATRAWAMDPAAGSPTFTLYLADDTKTPPVPIAPGVAYTQNTLIDPRKPVTSDPVCTAITAEALDAAITLSPNDAATRAAVDAEIVAMLLDRASPGATIYLSHLQAAVAGAPGVLDFTITSPTADVVPTGNNLIWLGTTVFS